MTINLSVYYSYLLLLFLFAGLVSVFQACSGSSHQKETNTALPDSTVFSDRTEVRYAEGFRISYHSNYKLLEILNPFQDVTDTLRYVLRPRGVTLNNIPEDVQIIDIPIRSMIITSTTHIGLTEMLNANDIIKGVVGGQLVYNKEVRRKLERGEIVAFTEGAFNKEQALAMNPEVIMISGGQSSRYGNYRVLMKSGIDVITNSEWLETTPLGKAEWVKVMAALLNKEALANEQFGKVVECYTTLKVKADNVEKKPLVFNNMPYKGDWFVPGGDSFTAQFLKDAGASYPWFDHHTSGGLRLGFEVVYEVGLRADVWLNPGTAETKEEILAKDPRARVFKAFKTGRIYNNNKRTNASGGNDFWESGVVHPEIVLADLIRIFHPSVLPDHQLYYYRKVNGHAYE